MPFFVSILQACSNFKWYVTLQGYSLLQVSWFYFKFLILASILFAFAFKAPTQQTMEKASQWISTHLPPLEIKQGDIISGRPGPEWIETELEFGNERVPALMGVDTGDKAILVPPSNVNAEVIFEITRHKVAMKQNNPQKPVIFEYDFALSQEKFGRLPDGVINAEYFSKYFAPALFPILLIFSFIILLINLFTQNLFFTLLTGIIEKATGSILSFSNIVKISLIAAIPPTLFCLVSAAFRLQSEFYQPLYLAIFATYFLIAASVVRKTIFARMMRPPNDHSNMPD